MLFKLTKRACAILTICAFAPRLSANPPEHNTPPTAVDLSLLFEAATRRPPSSEFIADIDSDFTPGNNLPHAEAPPGKTNGVEPKARLHLLIQTSRNHGHATLSRHAHQWYLKTYVRTDEYSMDETKPTAISTPSLLPLLTIAELYDPQYSPYNRFEINYAVHSILLTKAPDVHIDCDELWSVFSIDTEFIAPILSSLSDMSPYAIVELARGHFFGISPQLLSKEKVRLLTSGGDNNWSISVATSTPGAKIVTINGLLQLNSYKYKILLELVFIESRGKWIFTHGSSYNQTLERQFVSDRTAFDEQNIPATWTTSLTTNTGHTTTKLIHIKSAIPNPHLPATSPFQIPDAKTYPFYRISDFSTGNAVDIYRPTKKHPVGDNPMRSLATVTLIILTVGAISFVNTKRKVGM